MLLEQKNAIVYGASGAIGSAVAHAFAAEGAQVFLAGRTSSALDAVAEKIQASGGLAEVATVDVMDEDAVEAHADAVVRNAGSLDISSTPSASPRQAFRAPGSSTCRRTASTCPWPPTPRPTS